jgi:hypothetical protein
MTRAVRLLAPAANTPRLQQEVKVRIENRAAAPIDGAPNVSRQRC